MRAPLRWFAPAWRVQRRRHPRVAARIESAALAMRGGLAGEVHALRTRVAELQRDHLLLAAHVATLTEQLDAATRIGPPDADAEAARQRARLAAIAFYEERIGRLEDQVGRRHARPGGGSMTGRRISDERTGVRP